MVSKWSGLLHSNWKLPKGMKKRVKQRYLDGNWIVHSLYIKFCGIQIYLGQLEFKLDIWVYSFIYILHAYMHNHEGFKRFSFRKWNKLFLWIPIFWISKNTNVTLWNITENLFLTLYQRCMAMWVAYYFKIC